MEYIAPGVLRPKSEPGTGLSPSNLVEDYHKNQKLYSQNYYGYEYELEQVEQLRYTDATADKHDSIIMNTQIKIANLQQRLASSNLPASILKKPTPVENTANIEQMLMKLTEVLVEQNAQTCLSQGN